MADSFDDVEANGLSLLATYVPSNSLLSPFGVITLVLVDLSYTSAGEKGAQDWGA